MKQKRDQFNWVFGGVLIFFAFFAPSFVFAQSPQQTTTSTIAVFLDETQTLSVQDFRSEIPIIFEIPTDVRLFKKSVRVELTDEAIDHELLLPGGDVMFDETSETDVETYTGQITARLRVIFPRDFDFSRALTGSVSYQGCAQKICQREQELPFSFKLVPDQVTLAGLQTTGSAWQCFVKGISKIDIGEILDRGLWFALLIAFVAGLLTSLTPCVLPIIPLTLAFIGVSPLEKKTIRLEHMAIFTLGMILMYAALGVISACLGEGLGFVYQSPLFILFLVVFFVCMALWMFGVFHWPVFSKIQTAVIRHEPQGRFRYLYAGLTIGFLAAPCVGPVVAPLLVYIATTHDILTGFVLMLAYALGLSVLFFVLGFFSNQWITKLGQHTRWVKNLLGILLLIVALFYFQILIKPLIRVHIPHDSYFDYDFKHAQTVAQGEGKGLVVDFYADWCVGCHEIEQFIWSKTEVRSIVTQKFVPVKIDCTVHEEQCDNLSDEFVLSGLPTILFLDVRGAEIPRSRLVGSGFSVQEFVEHLHRQEARLTP